MDKSKQNVIELMNKDTGNKEKFVSRENLPRKAVLDANLIHCEIYNPGKETITFRDMIHVHHPPRLCAPDGFCYLPHQYFIASVPSGNDEIRVLKNYGDEMFKGNKNPSRPEAKIK